MLYMAKGKSESKDVGVYMTAGVLGGGIFDMFYGSLGGPGYNTSLGSVCKGLKQGDIIQITAESLFLLASLFGNSWRLTAFAAGALFGGLAPKIFAAMGWSRYGIFDFDPARGTIKPKVRLTK